MTDRTQLRSGAVAAAATCAAGAVIGTALGAVVAVLAMVAAALATLAFFRTSATHGWITYQLKARSTETEVAGTRLRRGMVGGSVFVAGLTRPTIFCDDALLHDLDDDELAAVTLHERAHQLARDPLRNTGMAVLTPVLLWFRRGRGWLERYAAAREIAADRYAIANGADRRAIASALLKVPPTGTIHASAFAPAVELRLRALLGDEPTLPPPRPWIAILAGVVLGAATCLALLHPTAQVVEAIRVCCPS